MGLTDIYHFKGLPSVVISNIKIIV
jgi:hypothetical protein